MAREPFTLLLEIEAMNGKAGRTISPLVKLLSRVFLLILTLVQMSFAAGREAKNVILMISDGQGFNVVKATEYYTGRKAVYERFEQKYAMQTHSAGMRSGYVGLPYNSAAMAAGFNYAKSAATDSASAATAMYTGVKVYDNQVNYAPGQESLKTFFEKAAEAGKSIGAVSTVHWTHATPAAVFGHNKSRSEHGAMAKEAIYGSNPDNNGCDAGNYYGNLKVVMGPGNPWYDNNARERRTPKYDLIGEAAHWNDLLLGVNGWTLITTKEQFEALAGGPTPDKVFGMPRAYETLQYKRDGLGERNNTAPPYTHPVNRGVPDLQTMTRAALNVLDNNGNGFAIMIEGGAVDWAGHANEAGRLIEEQIDFNRAVEAVVEYLDNNTSGNNWSNTLLIVTSDHETGYLWGDGRVPNSTYFDVNGNGQFDHGVDYAHVKDNGAGKLPAVWFHSGSHTNSLVPFYAKGAYSERFERCVIGEDTNMTAIYDLDPEWTGRYIDNTCVFEVMEAGSLLVTQKPDN